MKKIILTCGILFLTVVVLLNMVFTANLNQAEQITILQNSIGYMLGIVALGIGIYSVTQVLDRHVSNRFKRYFLIGGWVVYAVFLVLWVLLVNPYIVGDSIHVANLAQTFYSGDAQRFLPHLTYAGIPLIAYMQAYPHQMTLAFVYSIFFRMIYFDVIELLRILNIVGIVLMVIALYKICQRFSKTYQVNQIRLAILALTFFTIPMLSTFVYGDIPSLGLCLFSVYFMMRYMETEKISYALGASILAMVAYMMRMNSLIFIIATMLYFACYIIQHCFQKQWHKVRNMLGMLIVYVIIAIVPTSMVQMYYTQKYGLDKTKRYPYTSYLLMAMEPSGRGNGWYNEEIAVKALNDPETTRTEYVKKIKERLHYFSQNLGEMFQFYMMKLASMWTENTYSAVNQNMVKEDDPIGKLTGPLEFYQKALLMVTCVCSLIVLIQNRNHVSLELIFLLSIFVGGFAFHVLWEAKSRYIIPYIVTLIPIASIAIKKSS